MRIERAVESVSEIEADVVIVGAGSGTTLTDAADEINAASGGTLARVIASETFSGKVGETLTLYEVPGVKAGVVVVTGLGDIEHAAARAAFRAAGAAMRVVSKKRRGRVVLALGGPLMSAQAEAAIVGAAVGCQGQDLYRAQRRQYACEVLLVATSDDLERGQEMAASVNLARRLVNEPADRMFPEAFAKEAEQLERETGLTMEVWEEQRLADEGMGAMLAVARGSARPPRLVMLRHDGGGGEGLDVALVGKGVTFDSGGLSLKPSDGMKTMKADMAGAATVFAAMRSIALRGVKANVIGLMGLVENMPGQAAMKLGDVLRARNGTTIEVLNTDAEGRLVLADVLSLASDLGARHVIDLATLTGACVVALGTDVAGLMTNSPGWCDAVKQAAASCGEAVWELPMFSDYDGMIQSEVADIKNIGEGRWGGAISAAKFLEQFVGSTAWVHLDIAGPAFLDKPKAWIDAGGTGALVRTVVAAVEGVSG